MNNLCRIYFLVMSLFFIFFPCQKSYGNENDVVKISIELDKFVSDENMFSIGVRTVDLFSESIKRIKFVNKNDNPSDKRARLALLDKSLNERISVALDYCQVKEKNRIFKFSITSDTKLAFILSGLNIKEIKINGKVLDASSGEIKIDVGNSTLEISANLEKSGEK